ncbi:hypothetical protein LIER_19649 [Lithospermum erythrorhizon]|uniref:Uncharacterized protein n=1 Tax=Lithospermum erythrorhizon TaxID=34254 RepID=A0AAV3QIH1_LITER
MLSSFCLDLSLQGMNLARYARSVYLARSVFLDLSLVLLVLSAWLILESSYYISCLKIKLSNNGPLLRNSNPQVCTCLHFGCLLFELFCLFEPHTAALKPDPPKIPTEGRVCKRPQRYYLGKRLTTLHLLQSPCERSFVTCHEDWEKLLILAV